MSGKGGGPLADLLTGGGEAAGSQAQFATLLQLITKIANNLPSVPISAGQYPGTTTNDNAAAGNIGEYVSSQVLAGAVSLSTGSAKDITSIVLTPGDWDVWGAIGVSPAGIPTSVEGWISAASASAPTRPNNGASFLLAASFTSAAEINIPIGRTRFSLAVTTTIYLSALVAFPSTATAYGFIGARRMR